MESNSVRSESAPSAAGGSGASRSVAKGSVASDTAKLAGVSVPVDRLPSTMRAVYRIHSWAILIVPAVGTLAAAILALRNGVSAVDLGVAGVLYVLTALGITLGFHRYFTHKSFKAGRGVASVLGVLGSMAGHGSVIYWMGNHRRHHGHADDTGDPHSPYYREDERISSRILGIWHSQVT